MPADDAGFVGDGDERDRLDVVATVEVAPGGVLDDVDGDVVTTYKIYHGTHLGDFLGVAPTGKTIQFETVDAMRVRDGRITDHWGVANLYSALQQLGQLPPS